MREQTAYSFRADPEAEDRRSVYNRFLLPNAKLLKEAKTVTPAENERALSADVPDTGGYLLAPMDIAKDYIRLLRNLLFALRPGFCRVYEITDRETLALSVPTLTDMDDGDWTSDALTGNEDAAMATGLAARYPHPLAKRIRVSNRLLRASTLDPEAIVNESMAYKHAVAIERGFMTGTGVSRPFGVFVAGAQGIPTTSDVSLGNSLNAIGADGLVNALYSLNSAHIQNATWIFHRLAMQQIQKLKDTTGRYLLDLSGPAPTILGRPVFLSEFAPSTFTAGSYVGIVGDFQYYVWVISLRMIMQRLDQLYAAQAQTGFIGRMEIDGGPVKGEAFARVTLPTS